LDVSFIAFLLLVEINEPIEFFSQSEINQRKMSNEEVVDLNLRIKQKEKDIEKLNGKIMKLDDDISALSDQIKKTDDEKKRNELKEERNSYQKQADGLREDIKRSETQLHNLSI
jgi:peptidoglycan hydrolase CwlO-like protein